MILLQAQAAQYPVIIYCATFPGARNLNLFIEYIVTQESSDAKTMLFRRTFVVYVAEQMEPVRRRAALKVVKLGMDTRQVIARFEAERQALALMDHPNIARVLDAGATGVSVVKAHLDAHRASREAFPQ